MISCIFLNILVGGWSVQSWAHRQRKHQRAASLQRELLPLVSSVQKLGEMDLSVWCPIPHQTVSTTNLRHRYHRSGFSWDYRPYGRRSRKRNPLHLFYLFVVGSRANAPILSVILPMAIGVGGSCIGAVAITGLRPSQRHGRR